MATKKKPKKAKTGTKFKSVYVDNQPLKDILFYLCDDLFVECHITRTGERKFSARFVIQKKKTTAK
jgi:hypothetical protein